MTVRCGWSPPIVGAVEAVDELGEGHAACLGVGLGHGVQPRRRPSRRGPRPHRLGVEVGGVVADPRDRGHRAGARRILRAHAGEGLLVEIQRLGAVLVDVGAVLHDARDVDRGVVGRVGVAVGHGRDAVAAERVRLVGHHEGVDVEAGVGRPRRLGDRLLDGLGVLQPPLVLALSSWPEACRPRRCSRSRCTPERLASSRSPVGMPLVLPTRSGSLISSALRSP